MEHDDYNDLFDGELSSGTSMPLPENINENLLNDDGF